MQSDNFEELRAEARPKRARAPKPADFTVPIEADIAAVTLAEPPAPEPVVIPAAAAPAEHIQEEPTMATTADTVTNTATGAPKFPGVFADMNDRAKGAMERGSKLFGDMNELTRGNVEALVESGRVAVRGFEQMGREAADYARRSFEQATANVRELASVKSPTEFVRLGAEQTRAAFDGAVAHGSHTTEAMLKLAGEIAQPLSNRFAVVADKVKTAA